MSDSAAKRGDRPNIKLHGIANCDTVKKARAWLAAQGAAHEFIDFKKQPPQAAQLQAWAAALGAQALLNRQGSTWRKLDAASQASASADGAALALLQAQPSMIKRPVVQWPNGGVSVGFDMLVWAQRLRA